MIPPISVKSTTNNGGTFYDVTIGGVTIIGCQRKQGTGSKGAYDFISFPQRPYQKNGVVKYAKIVMLDKETEEAVRAAIKGYEGESGEYAGAPEETTDLEPF
jgi:hypothetical protein